MPALCAFAQRPQVVSCVTLEVALNLDSAGSSGLRTLLSSVVYFADLDDQVLEEIAAQMSMREIPANGSIFFEGEGLGEAPLHLVVSGTVRVYKSSTKGREQTLRLFHAGDTFADVPLFDGGAYPASADALVDSTIAVLPRPVFQDLMRRFPEIAIAATRVTADRLRHLNAMVEDLALRRVISRVARLLISERAEALTQEQMASMIGTSREMVNRSLHRLEDEHIIALDSQDITILDPDGLSRIVDDG